MIEIHPFVNRIIRLALEEDLGLGDLTTRMTIDPKAVGKATLIAKEQVILAGLPIFQQVFLEVSTEVLFESHYEEGSLVPEGEHVVSLSGPLTAILEGERTALNFIQRMSGIATLTRQFVEKVKPLDVGILDTRKTAPVLRWIDKYAVRVGGGLNHRFGLFDGILIKDNHIAAAGSITAAVRQAKEQAPHMLKIEVEVEDLSGVQEALDSGADAVLLDNMSAPDMKKAVDMIKGRALVEASGGVDLDTVEAIARTGVDLISVGALTHSVRAVDLSLKILKP